MTIDFLKKKENTIKCSRSDSQSSSRDDVYVFMHSYIEVAEAENTGSKLHYDCSAWILFWKMGGGGGGSPLGDSYGGYFFLFERGVGVFFKLQSSNLKKCFHAIYLCYTIYNVIDSFLYFEGDTLNSFLSKRIK